MGPIVRRVVAFADLADTGRAVCDARDAAAAGDPDWSRWLDELARGEALVASLLVRIEYQDAFGRPGAVECADGGVWLERAPHPPAVERQIDELAAKDFPQLAAMLHARGIDIDAPTLGEMLVRVELGARLIAALGATGARPRLAAV